MIYIRGSTENVYDTWKNLLHTYIFQVYNKNWNWEFCLDFVQEDFKKIINTINYGMMQLEIQPWLK